MKRVLLLATGDTIAQRPTRSSVATGAELLSLVHPPPRAAADDPTQVAADGPTQVAVDDPTGVAVDGDAHSASVPTSGPVPNSAPVPTSIPGPVGPVSVSVPHGSTACGDFRVVAEDVLAEPSWDMPVATMLALARRIQQALGDQGFDGVVVAQGLESIEESALLADLTVHARGGIVFTGARRYLDDPYTDGPANLRVALTVAADPRFANAGALVCVDGSVCPARHYPRHHPNPVGADSGLAPAPTSPRTTLNTERTSPPTKFLESHPNPCERAVRTIWGDLPERWPAFKGEPETDVALIRTYPGMAESVVTSAVDAGARGVVLEGSANGCVPVELFTTISELTSWDIPVVVPVTSSDESVGPMLVATVGAVLARGFTGRQARIALMVALGGGGVTAVREWFGG